MTGLSLLQLLRYKRPQSASQQVCVDGSFQALRNVHIAYKEPGFQHRIKGLLILFPCGNIVGYGPGTGTNVGTEIPECGQDLTCYGVIRIHLVVEKQQIDSRFWIQGTSLLPAKSQNRVVALSSAINLSVEVSDERIGKIG